MHGAQCYVHECEAWPILQTKGGRMEPFKHGATEQCRKLVVLVKLLMRIWENRGKKGKFETKVKMKNTVNRTSAKRSNLLKTIIAATVEGRGWKEEQGYIY